MDHISSILLFSICTYTESASNKRQKLDDSELDSGDDESRCYRAKGDDSGHEKDINEASDHEAQIIDVSIGRHPGPRPSDGEVRSYR